MTAPAFLLPITDAAGQPVRTGISGMHDRRQTPHLAWLAGYITAAISGDWHQRGAAGPGHDRHCWHSGQACRKPGTACARCASSRVVNPVGAPAGVPVGWPVWSAPGLSVTVELPPYRPAGLGPVRRAGMPCKRIGARSSVPGFRPPEERSRGDVQWTSVRHAGR